MFGTQDEHRGDAMRILGWALVLFLGLMVATGRAQGLPPGVPEALARDLARNPDRVVAAAARLILGHGTEERLTAADIARAVAVGRAAARGRQIGRLLAADLDADGAVTGAEARAAAAVLAASARSRLVLAVEAADSDRDGAASAAEIAASGMAAALVELTEAEVARMAAFLTLDLDGDGGVTLDEVRRAAALAAEAPAPAEQAAPAAQAGDRDA